MDKIEKVLTQLQAWEIPYTLYTHPAAPTVEIALKYWKDVPATHCKNLFFRNHKGDKHYLVIFACEQQLQIHDLEKRLGQGKLSFASPERMQKYLGLSPGSVSPFGLINDAQHEVQLFVDENLAQAEKLSFHPNDNTASVVISGSDFLKFLQHCRNSYQFTALYE